MGGAFRRLKFNRVGRLRLLDSLSVSATREPLAFREGFLRGGVPLSIQR